MVRSRRFLCGVRVGFLATLGVGVGFFCQKSESDVDHRAIRLGTNRSHVHTAFYVTRDSIFTPFVECVFLLAFLCMYLQPRGTLLDLFSSVVPCAIGRLPDPVPVFCDMFTAVSS